MDNDTDPAAILYPDDQPKAETPTAPPRQTKAAATPTSKPDASETLYPDDKPAEEGAQLLFGPPPSEYALAMPEGLEMTREISREIEPVFRELNLSSAGVNKLLPHVAKFRDRILDSQYDQHQAAAKEWARAAKADPDIGRGNWRETESMIQTAMKAAGNDPEFNDLIDESKLGNHPAFIRALRNIGRRLSSRA